MLRKLAAVALALLALTGTARASGSLCVVAPQVVALVDEAGEALLQGEDISELFTVREGSLYAAGSKGDYRLYDAGGAPLGETAFSMIDDLGSCLIFRAGGLYGVMEQTGEVRLPARWTQLTGDGGEGFLALDSDPLDDRPDELVHIDAAGEERRTGTYTASGLSRVCSDRMPYMDASGRWGAADGRGDVAIPAQWRAVGSFEGGVARVAGEEGAGLIDAEGAPLIPPVYGYLERGASMIALRSEAGVEAWSPDGTRLLFALEGEGLEASLVGDALCVRDGERVRLFDSAGAVLAEGTEGTRFMPGGVDRLIVSDGSWGEACQWLMAPDGSAASDRYQCLLPLGEDRYAFMEMDGAQYYSADLDRLQWSWNYDSARWGLLDADGHVLLKAQYLEIRALGEDRLLLLGEEETALADRDGAVLRAWPEAADQADP